jgi:hypothetical protein
MCSQSAEQRMQKRFNMIAHATRMNKGYASPPEANATQTTFNVIRKDTPNISIKKIRL